MFGQAVNPAKFGLAETVDEGLVSKYILDVYLDPEVAPSWSVVILANEIDGNTGALSARNAIGRMTLGGGAGEKSQEIIFDVDTVTMLVVPAGHTQLRIDCQTLRWTDPDYQSRSWARGRYSCYAVPHSSARVGNNVFTGNVPLLAPGGSGSVLVPPTCFVEAVKVLAAQTPDADVEPFLISFPASPSRQRYIMPGSTALAPAQPMDWFPVPAGPPSVSVTNLGANPHRYTVVYKLRV